MGAASSGHAAAGAEHGPLLECGLASVDVDLSARDLQVRA